MQNSNVSELLVVSPAPTFREDAKRAYGLFKKEFILQGSTSFTLINRLLVGPLISLATTGILYASFFRIHPSSTLGEMSGDNYLIFVAFGFLMHTYMNAGYYCFSSKILQEAGAGTLQLLWIAPYHRLVSLFSLASMEGVKCLVILFIAMFLAGMPHRPFLDAVGLQFLCFILFLPICLTIGIVRSMVMLLHSDLGDFMDHAYLVFVLTACPYIPGSLLPKIFRPLVKFNPAYHMAYVMRGAWKPNFSSDSHVLPLALLTILLMTVGILIWTKLRRAIVERCFI